MRELARHNISIAGITEARLPGSDCRQVESATILHSGGAHQTNGVALVKRSPFDKALTTWKPISDRLLSARFAHKHGHLTIITAYAPTELSDTDTKDDFYNQLAALIQSVPPHDVLAILGDFNATTGVPTTGSSVRDRP